jgi:hypothetical protein
VLTLVFVEFNFLGARFPTLALRRLKSVFEDGPFELRFFVEDMVLMVVVVVVVVLLSDCLLLLLLM